MNKPYQEARNPQAIGENEYATAASLQFTVFTSCIGVITLNPNNSIFGIHLVATGTSGQGFTKQDADRVVALINKEAKECCIAGHINDVWLNPGNKPLYEATLYLLSEIDEKTGRTPDFEPYTQDDKVCKAVVRNGKLSISWEQRS